MLCCIFPLNKINFAYLNLQYTFNPSADKYLPQFNNSVFSDSSPEEFPLLLCC